MKGLGASRSSPRDVTFGSKTSLGPFSVSPAWRPWTRSSGVVGSFSMPALPAQRLRTALSADSSPESILFGPLRPRSRARRGRQASRAWRASAPGKACRREQAQRYPRRIPLVVLPESLFTAGPAEPERSPESPALSAPAEASVLPAPEAPEAREGQRPALKSDDFSLRWCERPGCYEWFAVAWALSPQRFCSSGCRRALRNVLDREARYRQRRRDGDRPLQRRSRPASMRPP